MARRVRRSLLLLFLMIVVVSVSSAPILRAAKGDPMRIVLLVDSSTSTATMLNEFRAGLNAFIDAVPEDAELTIITTGRQLRIREAVTLDRQKLHKAAESYTSDGGANSFLETMMEADSRFLKKAADKWSVIVVLSTDNGESREEMRIDAYNKFMNDFRQRGGIAHALIVKGKNTGGTTELASNLASNASGVFDTINLPHLVAEKMKAIGERLTATYKAAHH